MIRKILMAILPFLFLATSCISQNNKEQKRLVSLDDCYQRNINDSTLMTGWYYISATDSGFLRKLDKAEESYRINPYPIVTAEDMITLKVDKNNYGGMYLSITFGKEGTEHWRVATGKSIGQNLALIVDNKLLYTPLVNSEITTGVSALNRGDYSIEELKQIEKMIENDKTKMQTRVREHR